MMTFNLRTLSLCLVFGLLMQSCAFARQRPETGCLAPRTGISAAELARALISSIRARNDSAVGVDGRQFWERELDAGESGFMEQDAVWKHVLSGAGFLRSFVESGGRAGDTSALGAKAVDYLAAHKTSRIRDWLHIFRIGGDDENGVYGYTSRADLICFELGVLLWMRRAFPYFFDDEADFAFLYRAIMRRTAIGERKKETRRITMNLHYGYKLLREDLKNNGELFFFVAHELGHQLLHHISLWFGHLSNDRVIWFRGLDEMFANLLGFALMEELGMDDIINGRLGWGPEMDVFFDGHDMALTQLRDIIPLMRANGISWAALARETFLALSSARDWMPVESGYPESYEVFRVGAGDILIAVSA